MWNLFWLTLPAVAAAVLTLLLAPLASRLAVRIGAVDMPGERKVHTTPIPRLGGLAVVVSIAIVLGGATWLTGGNWQLPPQLVWGLALGVLPILAISIADDIRPVAAKRKLLAHTLGAVVAVSFGVTLAPVVHLFGSPIHIGFLAAPLSVLWLVGVTNAFNIIDGLDGLSAGLALISAMSMAAVFGLVGQPGMGGVALVLAGALAGFLPHNVHPARMFLGDTGATAIGFCLAAFALKGGSTLSTGFAALLPVFILGLPIADTFIAMARRSLSSLERRGGGVFSPDRNHIHHRLLDLGIDHKHAVLILYAAGFVLAGAAFLSVFLKAREAALFVVALLLAGFVGIHRLGYEEFAFIRRGTVLKVYEVPVVKRGMFVVFVDVFLAVLAAYLAIGMKTDQWSWSFVRGAVVDLSTTFAPITVLVFWWSGMYRGSWRVAGLLDLTRAFSAVAIVTIAGATLVELLSLAEYSLSLFAIYGVINLLLTAALRASYVILENTQLRASHQGTPVLIYGAGDRGVAAVRELFKNAAPGLRPVGFIDDNPDKRGKLVSGLPVFGTQRELQGIIHSEKIEGLLISTERVLDERLQAATEICERAGVPLFRLDIRVRRLAEYEGADEHIVSPAAGIAPASVSALALNAVVEPLFVGCEPCPSCDGREVYRSKARTFYERIRKFQTPKRIFRCHECGWRGWLLPLDGVISREVSTSPDLSALDRLLGAERRADRVELKVRDAI